MERARLVVLPNWLGDLVMAEPALRAWRQDHHTIAVVDPFLAPLVIDAGIADRVEVFDRRGRDRGLRGIWRRGRELAGHRSSEILVLAPSLRAAALAWASGAQRRVGSGGEARELFLTEVHRPLHPPRSRHLADTWLQMARGVQSTGQPFARPQWSAGDRGRSGWRRVCEEIPDLRSAELVAFAAGATFGTAKQWGAKNFATLARALREARGLHPVFVGSASQAERGLAEELAALSGGTSLAGRTDLPTLAAALSAAALFVGNDSGPMHLAGALGTPTIGIFGSTSPAWTAPRGRAASSVGPAPVPCSPCFLRTCPYARECFTGIQPAAVLVAAGRLLDESAATPLSGGDSDR